MIYMKKMVIFSTLVAIFGLAACSNEMTDDEKTQIFLNHTMQEEQIIVPRNKEQQQSDRAEINQSNLVNENTPSQTTNVKSPVEKQ